MHFRLNSGSLMRCSAPAPLDQPRVLGREQSEVETDMDRVKKWEEEWRKKYFWGESAQNLFYALFALTWRKQCLSSKLTVLYEFERSCTDCSTFGSPCALITDLTCNGRRNTFHAGIMISIFARSFHILLGATQVSGLGWN